MTNPTSNFGWQMPTSTDLVTDLPADFEVFGQAVDTSMADLKGGTTGQILSKATNADMDFTWITNDVGDITAVNVTAPITGGGTSGAVTIGVNAASTSASGVVQLSDSTSTTSSVLASTPTATKSAYDLANTANTAAGTAQTTANAAIPKSTVTTAGDVIYATGSSAVTRLGIGSSGQVLTVSGGAPAWATPSSGGGLTLLSTTTISTISTTISSISQSYKNLVILLKNPQCNSVNPVVSWSPNATNNFYGCVSSGTNNQNITTAAAITDNKTTSGNTGNLQTSVLKIWNYAATDTQKTIQWNHSYYTTSVYEGSITYGTLLSNSAITSLVFAFSAGATGTTGTIYVYGEN